MTSIGKIRKTERKIMEKAADLESQLVESLNAVGTIKRFGLEDFANIIIRAGYGFMICTQIVNCGVLKMRFIKLFVGKSH